MALAKNIFGYFMTIEYGQKDITSVGDLVNAIETSGMAVKKKTKEWLKSVPSVDMFITVEKTKIDLVTSNAYELGLGSADKVPIWQVYDMVQKKQREYGIKLCSGESFVSFQRWVSKI